MMLLFSPVVRGELEVTSSVFASVRPDGLGPVADVDLDGDGLPNFAEILAGTSPLAADGSFSVPIRPGKDGWTFLLPVCLDTCGFSARPETSGNLSSWQRHDLPPVDLGATSEGHLYRFTDDVSASSRRFARIAFALA